MKIETYNKRFKLPWIKGLIMAIEPDRKGVYHSVTQDRKGLPVAKKIILTTPDQADNS
jgi:hypothetical protein